MSERSSEVERKIRRMQQWLAECAAGALRLRGTDWFAWATAGGSNTVLLVAETGVAEILVTPEQAYVLTDEIEAERLASEEVPPGYEWHVAPWADLSLRERFVRDAVGGASILSDRPAEGEMRLPEHLQQQRWILEESERARYRMVGQLAAAAMTEVMRAARPNWTEYQLAGAGAEALWGRGLHPALTLAAGAQRMPRYRHPTASASHLGDGAMLVFCARGQGLYANLTRFVQFAKSNVALDKLQQAIYRVEAAGLQACQPGQALSGVYQAFNQAYCIEGQNNAIRAHHQGGITGYLAREIVASAETHPVLAEGMAVAFNPSLPGVKVEDTFLIHQNGLENLTLDADWPSLQVEGRARPLPLEAL